MVPWEPLSLQAKVRGFYMSVPFEDVFLSRLLLENQSLGPMAISEEGNSSLQDLLSSQRYVDMHV